MQWKAIETEGRNDLLCVVQGCLCCCVANDCRRVVRGWKSSEERILHFSPGKRYSGLGEI
jgi:hypothetical protein